MRQLARECLEASGYSVLVAPNGEAAIEVAKKHRGPIELVLTDVIMPGISGRALARALTAIRPEAKILYMSGYPNDLIAQHGLLDPDMILVEKPFTFHSLLTKLQQAPRRRRSRSPVIDSLAVLSPFSPRNIPTPSAPPSAFRLCSCSDHSMARGQFWWLVMKIKACICNSVIVNYLTTRGVLFDRSDPARLSAKGFVENRWTVSGTTVSRFTASCATAWSR